MWSVGAVRRGVGALDLGLDLGAGAEAGIQHAAFAQGFQGVGIIRHMLGLAAYRQLPIDAEPGEVFVNRLFEGRAAARPVDVLDSQQEPKTDIQ